MTLRVEFEQEDDGREGGGGALTLIAAFPAGGSQRLPRAVGVTLAKELIFTGGSTE